MTLFNQNCEGGTSGAVVSAANTTGTGNTPINYVALGTGASAVFDGTKAAHGVLSVKCDPGASGSNITVDLSSGITATKQIAFRGYFYWTVQAVEDMHVIRLSQDGGGTRTASVHLNNGKLKLSDANGTATGVFTASAVAPLNQWVRVEVYASVGTTTSNGTLSMGVYLGDSTTPIDPVFTTTTANLGTGTFNSVQTGKTTASGNPNVFWIDDTAVNDAATGLIGPVVVATATVTPTTVVDNSGVFTNQGGAASLQAAVADTSDTTYVESPTAPANKNITFGGFSTLAAGNVKVTVRARMQPTAGPTTTQTVELLQGTTVIASSGPITIADTWADYVLTLSGTQNSAITDRSALRVRITANQP